SSIWARAPPLGLQSARAVVARAKACLRVMKSPGNVAGCWDYCVAAVSAALGRHHDGAGLSAFPNRWAAAVLNTHVFICVNAGDCRAFAKLLQSRHLLGILCAQSRTFAGRKWSPGGSASRCRC